MGIQNLLPLLENSTRPCHVSEFRGYTVAVDSYCWLHKGARGCALELAKGVKTDSYVTYCLKYVKMLLSYDIKPIMVFDGRHLPAKLKTEQRRRDAKKQAKKQAQELLRLDKSAEAYKFLQQCIDIEPNMALNLIRECRKLGVDCIVAPYESDAQLAYFSLKGVAEVIISEDSDLLLFGCKKVLYKMDSNGSGQLVEAEKINLSIKMRDDHYSFDKFRYMCILSGCDYVDSLPGIGLKKALKFLITTAETNPALFLDKVPRYLNMRHLMVTDEYKEKFMVADATFKHQTVFDPFLKQLVPLTPVGDTKEEYCKNAGDIFNNDEALQLALGNLNPLTMEKIDNWDPSDPKTFLSQYSIWAPTFTHRPVKKKSSKNVKIVKEDLTVSISQNDVELEKELEFYKQKPPSEESQTELSSQEVTSSANSIESSRASSPIIGGFRDRSLNPFLKKKISKFGVTETSDNVVVKSRFFYEQNEEISQSQRSQDSLNVTQEQIDVENQDSLDDTQEQLVSLSQKSDVENLDSNNLGSQDEIGCEYSLEVADDIDVDVVKTPPESPTLTSMENLQHIMKKRKLATASRINKFRKETKKQLTIKDMFRRFNTA